MSGEASTTPLHTSPASQSKDRVSPLNKVPLDIAYHRRLIFNLEAPVQFDVAAWNKYWPYVDNIWCVHTKHDTIDRFETGGKIEKYWGGCRLERKWNHGGAKPDPTRKRKRREMGQCQAKFKLTMLPSGVRILERSKEGHSHDLDYIDSIKRCTGIRSVVTDPFFSGWEPAGILAFLKDPAHYVDGHDLLTAGGGKYLERREILNVFAMTLRKAYPNMDPQAIKEAKDKYQGMKTCNFKGCNMAFADAKSLTHHRKTEHEEAKHDHSDKLYTCPNKQCHRRKRSKGFSTLQQLRDHQIRMQHWGQGIFHGEGEPGHVGAVTEADSLPAGVSATAAGEIIEPQPQVTLPRAQQIGHTPMVPIPSSAIAISQHLPAVTDISTMLPLIPSNSPAGHHHHLMPMDPQLQVQVQVQVQVQPTQESGHQRHGSAAADDDDNMADIAQRQDMMQRLHQLEMEKVRMEQEMQKLRSALFVG